MSLEAVLLAAARALPMDREKILSARENPREILPRLGIEPAKRLLCWLLCYREDVAESLILQWHHRPDGRDVLRGIFGADLPPSARKRLETVLLTELETKRRVESGLHWADDFSTETTGFLSSYDPLGARWIFVIDETRTPPLLFEIKLTEREILALEAQPISGVEQVADYLRGFIRRERLEIVDASRDSLAVLVARALDEPPTSEKIAQALEQYVSVLAEPSLEARSPGALMREGLSEVPREVALVQVAKWITERKLGPWPPRASVLELANHLLRPFMPVRGVPPPTLPDSTRNELASLIFDWNGLETWRNRLEETAYVFWKLHRAEDARACASAAASLREFPRVENPIVRAALFVLFGPPLKF